MRVRHRIPSIFNLSMVDVLCCALGCVILLWLINLREAKNHEDNAEEQHRLMTAQRDSIQAERDSAIGMLMRLQSQIESVQEERDTLQKSLRAKRDEAVELTRRLTASGERVATLQRDLRERTESHQEAMARGDELQRKLKAAAGRVASLEKDLRASEERGETETMRGRELAEELAAARRRFKDMQGVAKLVPGLRAELKDAREQYAAEKALATALEKEIAKRLSALKEADKNLERMQTSRRSLEQDIDTRDKELALTRRNLASLREENKSLGKEAARVRAAEENRFAGIALTGRRVVFLVDTSGSMDLVDENTKAPTKWADVRNTVARLMHSMPDLEKCQVIVFAEKPAFLFAGEENWLDFNERTTPPRVVDALAKIKPTGGTDLFAALQLAFRMRGKGMDTIYMLSDGLPNLGEGVNADALNTLKEVERNDLLAKHIRKTLRTDWNRPLPGQPRVRINAIGFFYESPDVGAFLWALARENDGSFVGMSKP
jgi:hypothetical protein